jgi:UrcA family protein
MELQVAIRNLDDAMSEPDRRSTLPTGDLKSKISAPTRRTNMTKLTTLILTATLSTVSHMGLAAQSAHTPDSDSPKQLLVRYADLDLARPEGASVLFHRLQGAAKLVCSPLESRQLKRSGMFQHCVSDAMARAVTQVDRPGLSAYYRGKVQGSNASPFEIASSNQSPAR